MVIGVKSLICTYFLHEPKIVKNVRLSKGIDTCPAGQIRSTYYSDIASYVGNIEDDKANINVFSAIFPHKVQVLKVIRQYLGILVAGILFYFLFKPFLQTHASLKQIPLEIQWQWLFSAFCLILFHQSAYTYPFAKLLSGVTQRPVSFQSAWTLFHLANITRYLPGRIWGFVRLLSLSKQFGLSKTAVGSSLTLHVGIEAFIGGVFAVSLLFSQQMRGTAQDILEKFTGNTILFIFVILGIIAGGLFLSSMLSPKARQFAKTLRGIREPLLQKSFWAQWLKILSSHILLWGCQGLAFFLFVQSLVSVKWKHAGILSTSFAFAWIVGLLSFLTPGGLGVREGLLGILLANYMSPMQATSVALLCRVWMLSAEIVLAGIAFLYYRSKYRQTLKVKTFDYF